MVGRYELSDAQWQRIAHLLPGKPGDRGRTGKDNRLFVNAVLWVLRSGAWWQDLPERYGKWKTDPPPLKWSTLRYGLAKEDRDAEEVSQ